MRKTTAALAGTIVAAAAACTLIFMVSNTSATTTAAIQSPTTAATSSSMNQACTDKTNESYHTLPGVVNDEFGPRPSATDIAGLTDSATGGVSAADLKAFDKFEQKLCDPAHNTGDALFGAIAIGARTGGINDATATTAWNKATGWTKDPKSIADWNEAINGTQGYRNSIKGFYVLNVDKATSYDTYGMTSNPGGLPKLGVDHISGTPGWVIDVQFVNGPDEYFRLFCDDQPVVFKTPPPTTPSSAPTTPRSTTPQPTSAPSCSGTCSGTTPPPSCGSCVTTTPTTPPTHPSTHPTTHPTTPPPTCGPGYNGTCTKIGTAAPPPTQVSAPPGTNLPPADPSSSGSECYNQTTGAPEPCP